MQKNIIIYIGAVIIILVVVFLSQQVYSRTFGKTLVSAATNQIGEYAAKGSNWVLSKIYPTISGLPAQAGEVMEKRGDMIKTEVNQEKEKVSENIGTKIGNYFSGVANSVLHPTTPQACQPAQTSSSQ